MSKKIVAFVDFITPHILNYLAENISFLKVDIDEWTCSLIDILSIPGCIIMLPFNILIFLCWPFTHPTGQLETVRFCAYLPSLIVWALIMSILGFIELLLRFICYPIYIISIGIVTITNTPKITACCCFNKKTNINEEV